MKFINGLGLWGLFMFSDAFMKDLYALIEANPNSELLLLMTTAMFLLFIYAYGAFAQWLIKN